MSIYYQNLSHTQAFIRAALFAQIRSFVACTVAHIHIHTGCGRDFNSKPLNTRMGFRHTALESDRQHPRPLYYISTKITVIIKHASYFRRQMYFACSTSLNASNGLINKYMIVKTFAHCPAQ